MERTLLRHPDIATLLVRLFAARFDPDRRDARRGRGDRRARSSRRSTRSRASTRTGSCAASWRSCGRSCARTSSAATSAAPPAVPVVQARPVAGAAPAAAAPAVRDLRLLAARRGRAPARRPGRARRPALVGPPRGLPHRDPRPDEGADGQERADRAGRREGRLRGQAATGRRRPRGAAGGGGSRATGRSCRGLLDLTDNIVDGEVVPPDRVVRYDDDDPYLVVAADKGTATLLRHRQRGLGASTASGSATRSRPAARAGYDHKADGHHRARRVGVGQAPLPRARASTSSRRTSPSSASATCPATCSATGCCSRATSGWWPRSTTGTCSSIPTRIPRRASPSAGGCSSCRARPGATTTTR